MFSQRHVVLGFAVAVLAACLAMPSDAQTRPKGPGGSGSGSGSNPGGANPGGSNPGGSNPGGTNGGTSGGNKSGTLPGPGNRNKGYINKSGNPTMGQAGILWNERYLASSMATRNALVAPALEAYERAVNPWA